MENKECLGLVLKGLSKLFWRSEPEISNLEEATKKFLSKLEYTFDVDFNNPPEFLEKNIQALSLHHHTEPNYKPMSVNCGNSESLLHFALHIFKGEQEVFPLTEVQDITAKQYYRHVQNIIHDLRKLKEKPDTNTLIYLLERYAKWAPSGITSVSLYDQVRLQTAITACNTKQETWSFQEDEDHKAALIRVDFPKVDFLYSLCGDSVDYTKGVDYYLQMCQEYLAKDLLRTCNLPNCNYFPGHQGFILLVSVEHLEQIQQRTLELEEFFLKHFKGSFYFSLGTIKLRPTELRYSIAGGMLKDLKVESRKSAAKPFANLLQKKPELSNLVFHPSTENSFANFCDSLQQLGQTLADTKWFDIRKKNPIKMSEPARHWSDFVRHFGGDVTFHSNLPESRSLENNFYRLGNTDFAGIQNKGFRLPKTIPYLKIDDHTKVFSHWALFHCISDPPGGDNPLAKMTAAETLKDFFFSCTTSLLREKHFRQSSYLLQIHPRGFTLVCSPHVVIAIASQFYQKFSTFTNQQLRLYGAMDVYPKEVTLHEIIHKEKKTAWTEQNGNAHVTISGENFAWEEMENILHLGSKLQKVCQGTNSQILLLLKIAAGKYLSSFSGNEKQIHYAIFQDELRRLQIPVDTLQENDLKYLKHAIRYNFI